MMWRNTLNLLLYVCVGSSLLVRPVTDAGATSVTVYLPGKDEVITLIMPLCCEIC